MTRKRKKEGRASVSVLAALRRCAGLLGNISLSNRMPIRPGRTGGGLLGERALHAYNVRRRRGAA